MSEHAGTFIHPWFGTDWRTALRDMNGYACQVICCQFVQCWYCTRGDQKVLGL